MKKILVPLDFSNHGDSALPYAIDLAIRKGLQLQLAHIYDEPMLAPSVGTATSDVIAISKSKEQLAEQSLSRLSQTATHYGLQDEQYECVVHGGNVPEEIEKLADDSVWITVMGTQGRTGLIGRLFGSVTSHMILHSKSPVLAIPKAAKYRPIKRILYATDLMHDETSIYNQVVSFAQLMGASLVFLYVNDDGHGQDIHRERLDAFIAETDYELISTATILAKDILLGITDYVKHNEIDIISMTTHSNSVFNRLFHKSLTRQMALHTSVPLLAYQHHTYEGFFM